LRSRWKCTVAFDCPRTLAFQILNAFEFVGIFPNPPAANILQFLYPRQFFLVNAGWIINRPLRIRHGHTLAAELVEFLYGILSHIAGTGNRANLPLDTVSASGQHILRKEHAAVASRLRTNQRAAPLDSFARQNAGKLIANPLVLAEQIADFPSAYPNIAGRHIRIGTNMPEQFRHKRLAETHHFIVRFALRVKIGTAFAAAHRKGSQGILEDLLKGQKLQNPQIHTRMKPKSPFVRTNSTVHFNAKTAIDLNLPFIIHPGNAKDNHPFRLGDAFQNLLVLILRMPLESRLQRFEHFLNGLMKLFFRRLPISDHFKHRLNIQRGL